ncbi:acyl-acyl carrier protein thioesterase TE3, chloroplastic-like [Hordeum vulgare subsp. vulgare]|uniref:Thioesterase domain-containing protein n=1 Tax=Hordeum vulgare subsp. vulgare TaxID=112509 RepID=A0A8I6Y9E4_HORVV|nr:acyl-acyl carrier protein thioesterase TE3, chloroplastic-like [Hordeum vulgare subsp. vulgare]
MHTIPNTMQHLATNIAPHAQHPPPPSLAHAAWARARARATCALSGHRSRHSCRSRHVKALASCSQGISNGNIIGQDTQLRTDKFFQLEMTVHDSELDQYGVVHNAMYVVYIHKAREEMAASIGFSMTSIARTGNAMAVLELNLKYYKPLLRGAKFVVKVRLVQIKGTRILVDHIIETLPDRTLVLEATATVVCLNKDYRPTRVFPEMSSKLQRFFSSQDDDQFTSYKVLC